MKTQPLHLCFQGEEMAFKVIMPAIRSYLKLMPLEQAGLVEVAISEAVANALKASEGKFVNINLGVNSKGSLLVRIRDRGKGFDVETALARLAAWEQEIPEEALYAESGRGLWVIHQVFDKVQYNQPGNELLLVKCLSS